MLKLYNTLTRKKESFNPIKDKQVGLYTCGPTVYWFAHIGNLRTYIFEDILKRVLKYSGFDVKHVMNITDVGHLTSDEDSGEDKMIKALKREKKELNVGSILEIADFYTQAFKKDLKKLNIKEPDVWCKATEHIKEQIDLVKKLIENGYAYETEEAVYFDTSKMKDYASLARLDLSGLKNGARVQKRTAKKNPTDFALWLKLTGEHKNHLMNWVSPWGKGFPGWHVECSAMSLKYLGNRFDIHCGGIDHIPVHHTNERAQNIGALGHPAINFWMHGEFLILKKGKMAKSKGNIITLEDLPSKGFNPLSYRYLALGAHYRSKLTFSWEALTSAEQGLNSLYEKMGRIKSDMKSQTAKKRKSAEEVIYQKRFLKIINNDLDTPKALALAWKVAKSKKLSSQEKYNLLLEFDKILGLRLSDIRETEISEEIRELAVQRQGYRKKGKWSKADNIRQKIEDLGYIIEDESDGFRIIKKID